MNIIPVILSGGSGKRLWPLSNQQKPKPFVTLPNGETTLEMALKRAQKIGKRGPFCIVTREDLYPAHTKLNLGAAIHYILEPEPRDTAASIACAALYWADQGGPQTTLCILPADHSIKVPEELAKSIKNAQRFVRQNKIVIFGINATSPDTRYGYIQADDSQVLGFSEKPEQSVALDYLQEGNWSWNSGIVLASARTILHELDAARPDILAACKRSHAGAIAQKLGNSKCVKLCGYSYGAIPKLSFDQAVLEHTENLATIKCSMNWSDLGTWPAFEKLLPADKNGNRAQGHVQVHSTNKTTVIGSTKPIALIGVDELLVVDGPDAILVADKNNLDSLKEIAETFETAQYMHREMKGAMHPQIANNIQPVIQKPWGSYQILDRQSGYLVKRINVKPNSRLSLQSHRHRSELWTVVSGTAIATNGPNSYQLECHDQLTIDRNTIHRLENPAPTPLTIIEIQFGDVLDEEDIIRYEDDFGRIETK